MKSWNNFFLTFGKHKGKSIGQVWANNPDYVKWVSREFSNNNIRNAAQCVIDGVDIENSPKLPTKMPNTDFKSHGGIKAPNKFGGNKELMPFQSIGAEFIEYTKGNCMIADEMGLGKTIQAITYLELHPELSPVLIICPASLKYNWENELKAWLSKSRKIEIINGGKTHKLSARITIINYDIIKKWLPELKAYKAKVMIADESHKVKNQKSQRTKAIKSLSRGIKHKILLTGTPILNRPVELWAQLNIIAPKEYNKFTDFAFKYCDPIKNHFGWDFTGASNIEELSSRLQNVTIRRTKKEVLPELPDKRRTQILVKLSNAAEYKKATKNIKDWIKAQGDKPPNHVQMVSKIEYLKQIAAQGKLKAAEEFINNSVESGNKLVVFVTHREIIQTLMDKYSDVAVKIDGGTSAKARQAAVDQFQNNTDIKLFIGNIQAAGEGITLTAASDMLFMELAWTPAAHEQAEDRCHRIGQKDAVNINYLLAPGTIDTMIYNLLESKRGVISQINNDHDNMAFELMERFK